MTRELKVALIVGFTIVLTVAILVSDHLSKARRADLANASGTTRVVAQAPQEPIRSLDEVLPPALPVAMTVTSPTLVDSPLTDPATGATPSAGSATVASAEGSANDQSATAPVVIGQGTIARQLQEGGAVTPVQPASRPGPVTTEQLIREATGPIDVTPRSREVVAAPTSTDQATVRTAPRTQTRTPQAGDRSHTVASGESLYSIAKRYYGDASMWKRLAAANEGKVAENGSVRIGTSLVIPTRESLTGRRAEAPARENRPTESRTARSSDRPTEAAKPRTYTVRPGESLSTIARRQLGSASRAREIASLNKMDPDDDLLAGAVIVLPAR